MNQTGYEEKPFPWEDNLTMDQFVQRGCKIPIPGDFWDLTW